MSARNTAARVLAKIAANDPGRAIKPSEAVIQAWTEHLDGIVERDALDAVTAIYRNPPDRVPLAADIATKARDLASARRTSLRADLIAKCQECDEYGWLLGFDETGVRGVVDPARRCTHPTVEGGAA